MIRRNHSTYPKRRKNVHCRYSKRHTLKNDVFFHILLIFLLKIEKAHLQSANIQNENISNTSDNPNSPPNFSFPENSSHTSQAVPTIEKQATEITLFINPDSNTLNPTIPRSPIEFKKSVSKTDDLKLAKIEPSDYSSMMNVQSLDVGKSGDSFIGPRMKNTNWAPSADQNTKNENPLIPGLNPDSSKSIKYETSQSVCDDKLKEPSRISASSGTKSNDDFCKENSTLISLSGAGGTEYEVNEGSNPSKPNQTVQMDNLLFTTAETEEYREAKKMTKCIVKEFNKRDIVCVCNKTYCDKLLPIELPPAGKFSWYKSSYDGYRFHRTDGQLSKHTKYVKDYFYVNTSEIHTKQKFIGYGGGFSDSASRNIESLSKQTRRHLMRSYYGLFGLEYNIGRVPIGGTDFSPRFYTYMDVQKKFMLSEQDFKYKIPALQEAIEIIPEDLKLVGCSWTAPTWMKTTDRELNGELKPEHYQLYADYHVMFLDHYAKNGIKFWGLSAGNKPMTPFKATEPSFKNAMAWSPYKQSRWVNRYLKPTLNASGYKHVELIIGDENRDMITYYLKWFFDPLRGENCSDEKGFLTNEAYNDVSGISLHGYGDSPENKFFLTQVSNLYQEDKFILLGETACLGKPQLGSWNCAERYAKQMMNYFFEGSTGFIDRNLALDLEGGPSYLNNFLDAAIIVDTEKDEFYKQPMYYVIAHFSKFLIPGSVGVDLRPFNSTSTGIAAIAANRPDGAVVIVAYNRSPQKQNIVFVINLKHQFSLNISAKSINSVIITLP